MRSRVRELDNQMCKRPIRGIGTILGVLCLLLFVSCRHRADSPSEAAERYYGYLIHNDVDAYLSGLQNYDSLTPSYRSQLRDMFLQYLHGEQEARDGIVEVRAVRDTLIDSLHAHVFIDLFFGDDTQEQITQPLVLTEGGWRLQ